MALKIQDPTLMVVANGDYPLYYLLHNVDDYIAVLVKLAEQRIEDGRWYDKSSDSQTDLFHNNLSQHELITFIMTGLDREGPRFKRELHHFMQDRMYEGHTNEGWELERFEKLKQ